MKFTEWLFVGFLLFFGSYLIFNEHRILNEMEKTEQMIAEQKSEQVDVLVVPSKEEVNKVIEEYYKQHPVTTPKKIKTKPAAKKQQPANIDLTDIKVIDKIAIYIKVKEGFRAKAYKDNTQYSIGYGTRAKYRTETITVKEANIRLYKHIRRVIVPAFNGVKFRSIEQVYSAIDFSYNLGHNRFRREVVDVNGNIDCSKMMAYNKVRDKNGNLVYNEGLAQRRFENFLSCASAEDIIED